MLLEIDGLSFTYNSHAVLHGVSVQAGAGELLAILGPNGVGKTTLLKCVNAIHKPRGGAVIVEEKNVLEMAPAEVAREIGYVAQRAEAARLTVFDAVLMGRKPHIRWRVSERDLQIVDAALRRLHMDALCLRYIDELSGGELQKVCIARALVQEPRILLLDEPTSSLDLRNQMEIMTMIRRVVDEHRVTAVMTMHDLNTALRFADTVLFLKDGAIFAATSPHEVTAGIVETVYGLPVSIHHVDGYPVVVPTS
ncbi:iron ABC transporter ATP-binding protein [Oceanidesulfovibrio indonesiensis]|uniref:Iron ABC transporter ATP-binding protein n=2 Tax=Oceanidesulfovibrio indonesiensis TaxID=54767 RepID=A0A7M3MG34_9BACT|nr:iron ABC transporter ATP-binding protein [Oceanidesulfovibrio indonesiensis]